MSYSESKVVEESRMDMKAKKVCSNTVTPLLTTEHSKAQSVHVLKPNSEKAPNNHSF